MKVPLILKDIQSRTNEPQEKELIAQILEIQENSIRKLSPFLLLTTTSLSLSFPSLISNLSTFISIYVVATQVSRESRDNKSRSIAITQKRSEI